MSIRAEATLSALIESTNSLVWSVDLEYRLTVFNSALRQHFEEVYGIRPALGMRPRDLAPPERAGLMPPLYARALAEGAFQVEFQLADGRTLELALSPIVVDGKAAGVSVLGKDITRRKANEKTLREAEKKYRDIFDGALEGIFQASNTGEFLIANAAMARMLGYDSPEELKAVVTDAEAQLWADPEEHVRFRQQIGEQGVAREFQCRFRRRDGSIRWASLSARRVCDADGRFLCFEGFITDITERVEAEAELRESEARYRSTYEQAAVGIAHTSFKGEYLRCNARFAEIAGYPLEEIPNLTVQQMTHPEDRVQSESVRMRLSKGEDDQAYIEKRLIRKDGSLAWVRVTTWPQRDSEGRLLYLVSLAEDINDRKAAEERLAAAVEAMRLEEERYHTVFQTSFDAISISRQEDGKLLDVNQAFLRMFGHEREQVLGRTSMEIQFWANPQDRQRMVEAVSKESACRDQEFQLCRKSGEKLWAMLSAARIEVDGVPCILLVVRDISEARAAAEALRVSEERYRTVFQTSQDGVTITHLEDGRFVEVNQAFLRMSGCAREDVIGRTSRELNIWVNPEDRKRLRELLRRDSAVQNLEFLQKRTNGEIFWVLMSAARIELDGAPCILMVIRDISDAKAAAEALRLSEERYRTVFQTTPDIIAINRLRDGTYVDCNQAFLDAVGYGREEVMGRTSLELGIWANADDRSTMTEMVLQNSNCRGLEAQFKKKSGEVFWGEISASRVEIEGVSCLLSVTRDLSFAKAAENTIRSLAYYDALTGLPNRRMLLEKLHQPAATGAPGNRLRALLMVDLDNFKALNDALGHQKGDLLLQEVARRIAACVHESDVVSRLSGDEFVVLIEDLNEVAAEAANQTKAIGERILDSLGQPCVISEHEYLSTASIGITLFKNREDSTEDFLQQALIALHQAKAAGRNVIRFFSPALQATVNARATLEDDLRQAIKKKQFELYYQPQVESGRLTGVEALIRWRHPRRGIVPPDEFIPMAEETGLILPLGEWILKAACKQIAAWEKRDQQNQFAVAVNISALQFRQPEFVEQVLTAVSRAGSNPRALKLELTESMLAENLDEVIAKMTELKSHGLSFSLDDFGTGYSSLSYLKRLPLDQMKIDRAFVRDMMVDATSGAIAQTILSLGRAMGLSVIAEGVETEEQRGFLAGLGCHSFQGFLFSHPLPLKEFQAFREKYAKRAGPFKK